VHSVVASTAILSQMLRRFTPPATANSQPSASATDPLRIPTSQRKLRPARLRPASSKPSGSSPAVLTAAAVTTTDAKSDPASAADAVPARSPRPRQRRIRRQACREPDPEPRRTAGLEDPLHPLPNRDLDTGKVVQPGGYPLTDSTYATLLHRLTRAPARPIPPDQARHSGLLRDPNAPITTKSDPAKWAQVQADLVTLATMPTNPEPTPIPRMAEMPSSWMTGA